MGQSLDSFEVLDSKNLGKLRGFNFFEAGVFGRKSFDFRIPTDIKRRRAICEEFKSPTACCLLINYRVDDDTLRSCIIYVKKNLYNFLFFAFTHVERGWIKRNRNKIKRTRNHVTIKIGNSHWTKICS